MANIVTSNTTKEVVDDIANILGNDILKWEHFIKDYSEIVPSEDEKKLNGDQIKNLFLRLNKINLSED